MSQQIEYFKKIDDDLIYFTFELPNPSCFASSFKPSYQFNTEVAIIPFSDIDNLLKNGSLITQKTSAEKRSNGPYPIAVRYLTNTHAIIERPPFQIKVDYSPTKSGYRRRPIKPVTIWIPWTVLVADLRPSNFFSYSKLFFNDKPLESLDDLLATPYTSNVFGDSKICMGASSRAAHSIEASDYNTLYHTFINEYFSGGWNADLDNSTYEYLSSVSPSKIPNMNQISSPTSVFSQKLKQRKMSFYKSHSYPFAHANLYYSLSLLSLEETLQLVSEIKEQQHSYRTAVLKNLIPQTASSYDHYSKSRIIPHEYYSQEYCNLKVNIANTEFDKTIKIIQDCYHQGIYRNKATELTTLSDFIVSNLDTIALETLEKIRSEKSNSVTFNYSLDLSVGIEVDQND